jgi:multiple sugar transport system substrate-binding protein
MARTPRRLRRYTALAVAGVLLLAACSSSDAEDTGTTNAATQTTEGSPNDPYICDGEIAGPVTIEAWYHSGSGTQRDILSAQVEEFNASQSDVIVNLVLLPEGSYNEQVQAASAAGDLPDLLDIDGPNLANHAWSGDLVSIDSCLSDELRADLLPSVINQGTYGGSLYALSQLESGLGLYSRRSVLEDAGIRIPEGADDAWTADEIAEFLPVLRDAGYERPLNLRWNNTSIEWYTYAFSPIVWSAGGDLIDRSTYLTADGALNTPEVVDAMSKFQGWFEGDYVDSNEDDAAFESGRSVITWSGHWGLPGFQEVFGDDLLVLPLPDFGEGAKSGHGNWQWGVTTATPDLDATWAFMEFMLNTEEILRVSNATGGIPVRLSAANQSEAYGEDGPLRMYVEQLLDGRAVSRPQTPAYPTITSTFADGLHDIADGADPATVLNDMVETIDKEIEANDGYAD